MVKGGASAGSFQAGWLLYRLYVQDGGAVAQYGGGSYAGYGYGGVSETG